MYASAAVRLAFLLFAALGLGACAAANRFADNAVEYNLQSEKVQDSGLLLNVIRASKRRPLEFAEIQTITGANPASGSAGFSIPLTHPGTTPATVTPTLTLSGGPSVTVGVVNTQDFYEGILRPIPMSTVDLLVQRRLNKEMLLNLLISRITFSKTDGSGAGAVTRSIVVENNPGDDRQVTAYQALAAALIDHHLTTVQEKGATSTVGPPLTEDDLVGKDLVTSVGGAGLAINSAGWCDLGLDQQAELKRRLHHPMTAAQTQILDTDCATLRKDEAAGNEDKAEVRDVKDSIRQTLLAADWPVRFYLIQKTDTATSARLCLDEPAPQASGVESDEAETAYCAKATRPAPTTSANRDQQGLLLFPHKHGPGDAPVDHIAPTPKDRICEILSRLKPGLFPDCSADDWGAGVTIAVTPRSVNGVISYLGSVVRRETEGGPGLPARMLLVRTASAGEPTSAANCSSYPSPEGQDLRASGGEAPGCEPIFDVDLSARPPASFLHVRYDGSWYSIANTQHAAQTYEVLDIVNELLALNRSAKDLPTSNVVTLLGAP
jgi:hypothetical protein